jgi:dihydroxy-acid dehydratase
MAEALGMTLPGAAPVRANSRRCRELAVASGRRIVEMVADDVRPRQVITDQSIENAVTVASAVGASVNVVRHLSAIATEAGLDTDVIACFEKITPSVPLLCGVRPNGPHRTEDLEAAGGARKVMSQLTDLLHLEVATVNGAPLASQLNLSPVDPSASDVIRSRQDPVRPSGGLAILRGSLAPDGAIIKVSATKSGQRQFRGRARVFEAEAAAMKALAAGEISPGDAVVLRGLGPRGGPGTVFAAGFVAAVVGAGLSDQVAVITDGELSGLNRGITVGQVMPEAADRGPLAVVIEDDQVLIDLDEHRLDLLVPPAEIAARLRVLPPSAPSSVRGWLAIYRSQVQPIAVGATLVPRLGVHPDHDADTGR